MRKVVLFICISLSLVSFSVAQKGSNCPDDLMPKLGDNKMWGYTDLFGHWVINPIYTKVSPFVESKAVVMKGTKFGVIDCEGNVVLSPEFEKLTSYKYGKIWAMKNGLWGMMNDKGVPVLNFQFSQINPIAFTELSWVKKGEVWGLVNEEKGNFICNPQFKIAQVMSENATLVQLNEPTFGVINHVNCTYLIPHTITRVRKVGTHTILFEQNNKWGIFNELGKLLANAEYDSLAALNTAYLPDVKKYEIILLSKKGGKYGLISISGKEMLANKYDIISEYSDGFFVVKQNSLYGYSNRIGKIYIQPQYQYASNFIGGQAIVQKNGKYGVIDAKNQFIIKPNYDKIERNPAGLFYTVKDNTGTYFYSKKGIKVSAESFESIIASDSIDFIRVIKAGKTKYYNYKKSSYSFEGAYDKADAFKEGFALVCNIGKWGVINPAGKVIVPLQYDKIVYDWFNNKMVFRTSLDGKQGIVETSGKVLLANDFEIIEPSEPIYLKVKKGGKYGLMKNDGTPITEFVYDFISNSLESPGVPEWPAIMVKNEKFGLINEKGEVLLDAKSSQVFFVGESFYAVKEKKDFIVVTNKGQQIGSGKFDEVREFNNGIAAVKIGNKWGYIDRTGAEKIKPSFEDAGMFIQYMAPVYDGKKWGVIDVTGKYLVQPEYEKYETLSDGTRLLYKDGKKYTLYKGGIVK